MAIIHSRELEFFTPVSVFCSSTSAARKVFMNWHERCPKIMGVHEMVVVVDVVEGVHGLGGSIELPRQVHMHWKRLLRIGSR